MANQVLFKNILIGDIQDQKAKKVTFTNGMNVVTSTENHVGKSSLLKSLYYALGAEVEYDDNWDKRSKLYILSFEIENIEYKIVRKGNKFAVFKAGELELLTESVSRDLANYLGSIFDFYIYLPNKNSGKNEMAPPVFTYLPYYIDQDSGWGNEPYRSFSNLDQYRKDDRKTSLYYHLNVYNKKYVEILSIVDQNKETLSTIEKKADELNATLNTLQEESAYIIEANSIDEMDDALKFSKDQIRKIIEKVSISRSILQKLESQLLQYTHQLKIINEYNKIKKNTKKGKDSIINCPQCGYVFEKEIYSLVREQYSLENEAFMMQQIQLLINSTNKKLDFEKEKYLELANELKTEENKVSSMNNAFEKYVKHKGLTDTISSIQNQINAISIEKEKLSEENAKLLKELRKMTNKKETDTQYADFLRSNLLSLKAWDGKFEKKLKILEPLKGQGTLSSKIILAQYVSLFMAMETSKSSHIIKFPFVVDSPRGKEASKTSSSDILKLIIDIKMLPQVIMATMDFDDFEISKNSEINIIRLNAPSSLLNSTDYLSNEEELKTFLSILNSLK